MSHRVLKPGGLVVLTDSVQVRPCDRGCKGRQQHKVAAEGVACCAIAACFSVAVMAYSLELVGNLDTAWLCDGPRLRCSLNNTGSTWHQPQNLA